MQLTPPCLASFAGGRPEHLGYFSAGSCRQVHILFFFFFFFSSSQLCCPLRFQNSPQTHWWEDVLLFGNFSSFLTLSPGWVSVPNSFVSLLSFIFCSTSFRREWAAFLGAWCPLPVFRSCFVEVSQRSNDLLINLWGRKWSPHPIPPPSSDRREGLFKY